MNRLPPLILRRLVLAPAVIVLCLGWIALAPVLGAAGALHAALFDRKARILRLLGFSLVYAFFEVVSILVLAGLWVAAGGVRIRSPRSQALHFRYMRWWLKRISRAAARFFGLRIHIEDPPEPQEGPVLVFSRHAGPGNSLMLVGTLMIGYRRLPRIVMLAKLQWDPLFDMIGHRLPNRFIQHDRSRRDRSLAAIAELASDAGPRTALVLFPEGRDFSHKLRLRAIAHLRSKGHEDAADRAEEMRRVLPPRPGGVAAAVEAAPEADVVFVAHTVLEDVGDFSQLWYRIPFERPVTARYWRIPAPEIPREPEEMTEWLYGWWERIDDWIQARIAPPPADSDPSSEPTDEGRSAT